VNPAKKVAAATDPTKAMKGRATRRVQPGRGAVPDLAVGLTPATGEAQRSGRCCKVSTRAGRWRLLAHLVVAAAVVVASAPASLHGGSARPLTAASAR
jgi:hypothetical protein